MSHFFHTKNEFKITNIFSLLTTECSHYTWELEDKNKTSCKFFNGTVTESDAFVTPNNPYIVCGIKDDKTTNFDNLPIIGKYET